MNEDKFSNDAIAHLLRTVADAYLLKKENRFKVIAYQKAADTVEHLTQQIKDIWEDGQLFSIKGIGPSILQHLDEYLKHGYSKHFDKIFEGIPLSVFELTKVPSIGPKKAFKLVNKLRLLDKKTVFNDLLEKARKHKISNLDGFGSKSEEQIVKAVSTYLKNYKQNQRMLLTTALTLADDIVSYLKKVNEVDRVDVLGSLRRMAPTIGDIDISVRIKNPDSAKKIINHFINYDKVISVDNAGEKKASIIVFPNIRVDLRVIEFERYGTMLQYFTGNKAHNIKLREYAMRRGYSVSEYSIKEVKTGKTTLFASESEVYKFLKLQYIPPELRKGEGEILLASQNKIPKLVNIEDVKGDLHIHSNYDIHTSHDLGKDSLEKIIQKAEELNYEYIGITDHNPKLSEIINNNALAVLKERSGYFDKIISLNNIERLNIFIGIEADILPDGKIALPDGYEKYLDYVIASVHSSFNMSKEKMTKRILRALSFPKVKFLGHPTGRLLGRRESYEVNWDEVFSFCKYKNIALEVNSSPLRLDLPDMLVKKAVNNGLRVIVNTDAHAVKQMENMPYGVSVLRRGWAKKSDVLNTLHLDEFRRWILS